jgi:RAT1-interacting protein
MLWRKCSEASPAFELYQLRNYSKTRDHWLIYLKEIACFSYDEKHQFRLDDSSIKWYHPPDLGADLSKGFDTFQKLDDTADDHLDSLLKTIIALEQKEGKRVEADIITWRGMMTKVCHF